MQRAQSLLLPEDCVESPAKASASPWTGKGPTLGRSNGGALHGAGDPAMPYTLVPRPAIPVIQYRDALGTVESAMTEINTSSRTPQLSS